MTITSFDPLATSRSLRQAGFTEPQADAVTEAVRSAAVDTSAIGTELQQIEIRLDAIDGRLDAMDSRLDSTATKADLDLTNSRFDAVVKRFETVATKADLTALRAEMTTMKAELTSQMAKDRADAQRSLRRQTALLGGLVALFYALSLLFG